MGRFMTSTFAAQVAQMAAKGLTRAQQAETLGMTESSFYRRLRAEGVAPMRAKMDHSAAIPWTVGRAHDKDTPTQYLRELSATAQGHGPLSRFHRNTALNWAADLILADQDITFDDGYKIIPANPQAWHIKTVYLAALKGMENE